MIVQTVLSCALISMLTSDSYIDNQFSERSIRDGGLKEPLSTGVIVQGRGHLVAMPIRYTYTPCSTASDIERMRVCTYC